jgi:hypothetical protein
MATVYQRGDGWSCQFLHKKARYTFAIGKVDEAEARAVAAKVDYPLMRLRQRLLSIPAVADIVTFVRNGGHPPEDAGAAEVQQRSATFAEIRDAYLRAVGGGAIEGNTLATTRIHFAPVVETLGERFALRALGLLDLQGHIDRRVRDRGFHKQPLSAATVKKELATLRAAWSWVAEAGLVEGRFRAAGCGTRRRRRSRRSARWPR